MTTVKRITDLMQYTSVLPYASEMFGVYQPLLGWRSKRIAERFNQGFQKDKVLLLEKLKRKFKGIIDIKDGETSPVSIEINPGVLEEGKIRVFDSVVLKNISGKLPSYKNYKPSVWPRIITNEFVDTILKKNIVEIYSNAYLELQKTNDANLSVASRSRAFRRRGPRNIQIAALENQLRYESQIAGLVLHLVEEGAHNVLKEIFYISLDKIEEARTLIRMLNASDSIEAYLDITNIDPANSEHLRSVVLSPISVVHLFRQYFFELDTFLGTPESHVWLSPGSSVELLEVHTRKSVMEKTLETTLDILSRTEKTTTLQEEISDAVKEDNAQDIKFGTSVTGSYASIQATASFDYNSSQKQAREKTHKSMRQQTEKLSTEIRSNFKSIFKTQTEVVDFVSTKHIMTNKGDSLMNYELRRKMRQVGVQVQDIGTFLCWQTYVDDPANELGIAKLVHIAKPAELDALPRPQEIPKLLPFQEQKTITIPFISIDGTGADNRGEVYVDGVEVSNEESWGWLEKIKADFPQEFVCPKSDYELTFVEFNSQGQPISVSRTSPIVNADGRASFDLHLDSADFQGKNSVDIQLTLQWSPTAAANAAIDKQNKENYATFNEAEKAAHEKAFVETVKERIGIASKITTRRSEILREEERIVVYRKLIQDVLFQGVTLTDDRTRHVVAELINSIFDVDKMLYFVAPEWWRPRLHKSKQQLHENPKATPRPLDNLSSLVDGVLHRGLISRIHYAELNTQHQQSGMGSSSVGWGGINDTNRDNYYITEDSEPAKMGSSLGWLLQLDGDNMRNAFLNAPWVKAVLPIRPGREEAAINWLKGVEGMNGITDDVIYHASNPNEKDINGNPLEGQKMIDVLMDLAKKIERKYQQGIEAGKYPEMDEVSDPALVDEENIVTATPIDRVYEHGFFPLEGSFRLNVGKNYEIFDQWIEILPTDQIVPVEVEYNPKTGRQI